MGAELAAAGSSTRQPQEKKQPPMRPAVLRSPGLLISLPPVYVDSCRKLLQPPQVPRASRKFKAGAVKVESGVP